MKKTLSLWFEGVRKVCIREENLSEPSKGEVLVKGHFSALSQGTERLIYFGQVETDLPLDPSIASLSSRFNFPFKYGYSNAGVIEEVGEDIDGSLVGRKVFSFQPHQTYFLAQMEELFLLDQQVDLEVASLFPLLETAFTLLLDGTPRIGEWVLVLGQGSIGLMLTALLSRTGAFIVSADPSPLKQELSKRFGAMVSLDPYSKSFREECLSLTEGRGFDLIFEISGNPQALNLANSLATFESEIIVGSWYGKKLVNLGTPFHRGRLRLKSSQVSTLPSKLSGHWNKERRSKVVWKLLQEMNAKEVISHRLPLEKGAEAFRLLEDSPVDLIQVVFTL